MRSLGQREVRERAGGGRACALSRALRVKGGEIAHDHAERPAVADDVVRGKGKQVTVRGEAEDFRAHQRAVLEIERCGDDAVERVHDPGVALEGREQREIVEGDRQRGVFGDEEVFAVTAERGP